MEAIYYLDVECLRRGARWGLADRLKEHECHNSLDESSNIAISPPLLPITGDARLVFHPTHMA